jgi:lipopolysaccharide biosynthesis glycosyltransferase
MTVYNILVACDHAYYVDWAKHLLKSIHYHAPWVRPHCHIVNPQEFEKLSYVDYTFESIRFESEDSRIGYLQAVRFLVVADKFNNDELVMTLDADTICTRAFAEQDFSLLFKNPHVLLHPKDFRWLAGLVTFDQSNFRREFADRLRDNPVSEWKIGQDQKVLAELAETFNFTAVGVPWMAIGKNKEASVFLTLKGKQKDVDKYFDKFLKYRITNEE